MKLNEKQPYATIHGHSVYVYEQNGKYFNGMREQVDDEGTVIDTGTGSVPSTAGEGSEIQTDGVTTASAFLKNLLGGGAMAKSILYSQAEGMQLSWVDVNKAATAMKIIKSQRDKKEFWQLAES